MSLVGRKCGMTRVFTEDGESIPVTVIEAQSNRITQVKTVINDGYSAVQVTAGKRKASRVSRPEAGHFAKAKVEAGDLMTEFRIGEGGGRDGGAWQRAAEHRPLDPARGAAAQPRQATAIGAGAERCGAVGTLSLIHI